MKISKDYNGILIDALFSIGSLLLTVTVIIPILSVIPGTLVEMIVRLIVDNEPHRNVGQATIIALTGILVLSLLGIAHMIRKRTEKKVSNTEVIAIMTVEYFIVHSLGFYIYLSVSGSRSDGQSIMMTLFSHPYGSIGFLAIGAYLDLVKKYSY